MNIRQTIAENILGEIDWRHEHRGFCRCPGGHLHSGRNGKRDCEVRIDGAPTIHCMHTSCAAFVEDANHRLRSEVGVAERTQEPAATPRKPSKDELERQARVMRARRIRERARRSVEKILREFATDPEKLIASSPVKLGAIPLADRWRQLLHLFPTDDVVWIGSLHDSGQPFHAAHFRRVSGWLACPTCPGPRIVPAAFRPDAFSRSKENVLCRRFFVVESDRLTKPEQCAVIRYVMQFARLRAVVDSGNRSLHGWFELPPEDHLSELELILPELGVDPAGFRPAQPFRMPGVQREDRDAWTDLLFLDAGGKL